MVWVVIPYSASCSEFVLEPSSWLCSWIVKINDLLSLFISSAYVACSAGHSTFREYLSSISIILYSFSDILFDILLWPQKRFVHRKCAEIHCHTNRRSTQTNCVNLLAILMFGKVRVGHLTGQVSVRAHQSRSFIQENSHNPRKHHAPKGRHDTPTDFAC